MCGDKYRVELTLLERTDDGRFARADSTYVQVNPAALTFDGTFGIPLEFKTDIAGVELDLAMAVSRL
jgi:hypothetical protein